MIPQVKLKSISNGHEDVGSDMMRAPDGLPYIETDAMSQNSEPTQLSGLQEVMYPYVATINEVWWLVFIVTSVTLLSILVKAVLQGNKVEERKTR